MQYLRLVAASLALVLAMSAAPALGQQTTVPGAPDGATAPEGPSLEALLQQFDATAPEPPGSIRLDAWVETSDAGKAVVVLVVPEGEAKLVADPGITVTPAVQPGVDWQLPLPHRMVDPERDYFDPPAMVRLPFSADHDRPLKLLVEYAYCFVDFQCFFGEEELTVADGGL